ncbi:MAG: sugar ABC transporter permease [Chloroflexi bacterium]|nr:MAG: sugar ABC transporter permease [Chloroflexota bacterium]
MAQRTATLPNVTYPAPPQRSLARRLFGPDWQIAFPFILPVVALMLLFIAWPFLKAVWTSMTVYKVNTRTTEFVWFENYVRLWQDPFYREAVRNTFVFTTGSITFKLLLGLCAALLLNSQKRFRNLLTGLVLLPWIIPSVVQALAWRSILDPLFGGLNPILLSIGVISQPLSWLADPKMAMGSVIAVNVWAGIPFFTVNMLAGMQAIDKELYEAAEIDGANAWDRLLHITLPSLRYVIVVATLLSTIWTFNGFETIFLLTGGGPGTATTVYTIKAYTTAIRGLRFGPGTAIAFSLTPVLALFILLLARYMRRDAAANLDVETWQDKVLNGIGAILGFVGWLIALPVALIVWLLAAILPAERMGVRSQKRLRTIGALGRAIGLTLMLVFILFPFYWIIITAFKTELQISQRVNIFWPAPWTLDQFDRLFFNEPFFIWFRNSATVAVATTFLAVLFASLGGYALARLRFLGAQTLTTALLITYLLPGALMFIPLYQILASLRVTNTLWALILTYPTSMIPFATWLLMGYYRAIPEELEHAALVDGATRLQAFLRVTLPLTAPALLAVTLFSFTAAWKEFLFAFVFISSQNLMTLPVGLAQKIFGDIYPWGLLMAASLVISIPVVIFYMYGQRFMIAGLTAGSVKG